MKSLCASRVSARARGESWPAARIQNGRALRRSAGIIAVAGVLLLGAGCALSFSPGFVSDHFDGWRFHQPEPLTLGFTDWLKRTLGDSRRGPWRDYTDTPPGPPPPARVDGGRLRVTFVNHATLLIQMDGLNILTDPIWSKQTVPIFGVRRRRPPGVRFEDLPPIDVILVSHDHYDHMDLPTLRRLVKAHRPHLFVGLGNAAFLAGAGVPGVADLDWWQSAGIAPGVTVTAVLARHKSGRGLFDQDHRLWCGFVVQGPSGSVYFAGDTGWGSHFAEIGRRFPNLRLALLPIGGFKPRWYQHEQHLGPADAVAAHRTLSAATSVPIHFGTFPNGDDAETEPVTTLRAVLDASPDVAPHFVILDNGESAEIPPTSSPPRS
jgi:L-ascorbate metabolism protein UlaG (beta-lactamase superfamily)